MIEIKYLNKKVNNLHSNKAINRLDSIFIGQEKKIN